MPKRMAMPKTWRAMQTASVMFSVTCRWHSGCPMSLRAKRGQLEVTLRIEKIDGGPATTIRLIGRIRAELLEELNAQIKNTGTAVVLDLEEVSLVDLEVVRFLGACQSSGINLVNVSPYINDWIAQERAAGSLHGPESGTSH